MWRPEGKISLARPRRGWEYKFKIGLQEVDWGLNWIGSG